VATLIVTGGTAMYGLDVLGGLVAGESLVVTGAGPIGLSAVAVGKALGADPGHPHRHRRQPLAVGTRVGADVVINASTEPVVDAVRRLTSGRGVNLVFECSGAPTRSTTPSHAEARGARVPGRVFERSGARRRRSHRDQQHLPVRDSGRRAERRAARGVAHRAEEARPFPLHTHTFAFDQLPTAIRYFREKVDGAIKVVIKPQEFRD
jgi:L-iditol 2-dehydrogenase